MSLSVPSTFSEVVELRADSRPESRAYTFLLDGESQEESLSYEQLRRKVRAIGGLLQEAGARGERVLLLFPPGLDYVAAFLGCLHAGAIAVPAYPPDPMRLSRTLPRLESLISDARARFALTVSGIREMAESLGEQAASLGALHWLCVEEATEAHAAAWKEPGSTSDTLAMLQYTSGSTGSPRGVMLTHGNLLHNSAAIQKCFGSNERSVGVIWLPPYHDMGLIGGILQPLYVGFPVVLMSPLDFLARPLRWLQAVSRYRGTISGGPNFAFELCVRKVTPEERAALDLSSWDLAFNGAEPIHPATLLRFCETFAPSGFRTESMYPCYGLAEATLIAAGGRKEAPPVLRTFSRTWVERGQAVEQPSDGEAEAGTLVGCGFKLPEQELLIMEPESRLPVAAGRIGEIWLRGPSIAKGYWSRPEETQATFQARRADTGEAQYLRTGDLGFLQDGELFVTGRIKDLIIVRGRNHYPHDLERTAVACHPALRPGCSAVFEVTQEGEQRLVLVQEVDTRKPFEVEALVESIRSTVADEHGVHLHAVVLIPPGSIPKTSSGKIQRRACREAWLAGQLQVVASDVAAAGAESVIPTPRADELRAMPREQRTRVLESWLISRIAAAVHVPTARIDRSVPLVQHGLDSLRLVELRAEVETATGVSIPLVSLMEGLRLDELSGRCVEALEQQGGGVAGPRREPRDGSLPLSYPQEEMWLASRLERGSGGYHIPAALMLRGELRTRALEASLRDIIHRHEALRTCFPEVGGTPVQRILPAGPVPLPVEDWCTVPSGERDERVRQAALAEALAPMELERGPLYRARLLRLEERLHVLLFTVHHAVADGWSMGILVDELARFYSAHQRDVPPVLPELPYQYADYAVWQRRRLTGEHRERLLSFWRRQLVDLPAELRLPTDREQGTAADGRGASLRVLLRPELTQQLQAACAQAGVTPFMWLLAAFQVLLSRTTAQEDVPVGVAVLGREVPGTERLLGNFINMVVMRTRLGGDPSFADLLKQVRHTALESFAHQELPFELLAREAFPERTAKRQPLFRVAFGTQNQPRERLVLSGLEVETLALDYGVSRLDLTLWVSETPEGMQCVWTYATRLFDASTVERLHRQLERLLAATLERMESRLSALPLEVSDGGGALKGALAKLGSHRRRRGNGDSGADAS